MDKEKELQKKLEEWHYVTLSTKDIIDIANVAKVHYEAEIRKEVKMAEDQKKLKNAPDYTNSAENLCNPAEVMDLLAKLHAEETTKATLEGKVKKQCAELVDSIARSGEVITQIIEQIRGAVDAYGSYQDIETGEYAVKYRRITKTYHVEPFKERFPKYVNAVVEEAINIKALEGLVKGGLIKEDELLKPLMVDGQPVITETPQYAYFIRRIDAGDNTEGMEVL